MSAMKSTSPWMDSAARWLRQKSGPGQQFLLLGYFWGLMPAMLVVVNVISGAKVIEFLYLSIAAGTIFFRITYVFDDIVGEIYGAKNAVKVIVTTFLAQLFCMFAIWAAQDLRMASFYPPEEAARRQAAYDLVLGTVPLVNVASLIAVFFGRSTNTYVLCAMRDSSRLKTLWGGMFGGMFSRFVVSTIAGEAVDTLFFLGIAFGMATTPMQFVQMYWQQYLFKVVWEVVAYPIFSHWVVLFVKKVEGLEPIKEDGRTTELPPSEPLSPAEPLAPTGPDSGAPAYELSSAMERLL